MWSSRSLSTSSTIFGWVFTYCAEDLGFSVVSVSVLPPLKRTWILVVPSFRREFDERGILDEVGEQTFAFAVRRARISPELLEVCGHRDEPFADCLVENKLVFLSPTLPLLSCLGQGTQLVVPLAFQRIGDEAITRIDQHESALREIRF